MLQCCLQNAEMVYSTQFRPLVRIMELKYLFRFLFHSHFTSNNTINDLSKNALDHKTYFWLLNWTQILILHYLRIGLERIWIQFLALLTNNFLECRTDHRISKKTTNAQVNAAPLNVSCGKSKSAFDRYVVVTFAPPSVIVAIV